MLILNRPSSKYPLVYEASKRLIWPRSEEPQANKAGSIQNQQIYIRERAGTFFSSIFIPKYNSRSVPSFPVENRDDAKKTLVRELCHGPKHMAPTVESYKLLTCKHAKLSNGINKLKISGTELRSIIR